MNVRPILLAGLAAAACATPRPARFAIAPPVTRVTDDRATRVPQRDVPVQEFELAEAYLRHPMVGALDPARVSDALDINALDEVPRSSWYGPDRSWLLNDADAPQTPLSLLTVPPESGAPGISVVDATGRRFELRRDPSDRPEMCTAAAAISRRILARLGYYTAPSWVLFLRKEDFRVEPVEAAQREKARDLLEGFLGGGPPPDGDRFRVSATRWPIGKDLGPTRPFGVRRDNPNDHVAHEDRRTLRAFAAFFAWLGISQRGAGLLRDTYLGDADSGHVVHVIVDLGDALGAGAVVRPLVAMPDDSDLSHRDGWESLASFGVVLPKVVPTDRRWTSLGAFEPRLTPADFIVRLPFEPIFRALGSDVYWAAKKIADVEPAAFQDAISAGYLSDPSARARLADVLSARRVGVLAWAMSSITACEVERLDPTEGGAPVTLVLRDESILRGVLPASAIRYEVRFLDDNGRSLQRPLEVEPSGALVAVPLPQTALDYMIAHLTSIRSGRRVRRALQIHLAREGLAWRVVGVRH